MASIDSVPIAIVGMAMNLPGSETSSNAFWDMLCKGRNVSSKVPKNRYNAEAFYHADTSRHESLYADGGHFLAAPLDRFDAPFFNISPKEAACMDPQHRLLLETTYHALESAGISIQSCAKSETAVYIGTFMDDYKLIMSHDPETEWSYGASGLASNMAANRISWFFDFKGPSVDIDTACSSSLTALHLACQDLRSGSADMGVVGGSSLIFHPGNAYLLTNMSFLASDNRSRSFDSRASGYARGEGLGILVVKRLDDAVRAGDTVRAIIRASSSGQDGRTPGITVPSGDSQLSLIRKTYSKAGLAMDSTRYCEAHATGTAVGDPIEANSIGEAFSPFRNATEPMMMGSVKANIGHLEAASGVVSVIKTVLSLESGVIPPVAGLELVNPKIEAKKYHLHFPSQCRAWPTNGLRRAFINSFGFGGSNATLVLDDAFHGSLALGKQALHCTVTTEPTVPSHETSIQTPVTGRPNADMYGIICLSAVDKPSLEALSDAYVQYLVQHAPLTESSLASILYTTSVRRSSFQWRSALIARCAPDLETRKVLADFATRAGYTRKLSFVFTGQGSQYQNMGQTLCSIPEFMDSIISSSEYLSELGLSLPVKVFLTGEQPLDIINEPHNSQPVLTAFQIALVDVLRLYNVQPSVVLGHSSGEIAAAYCASYISRQDALRIAFYRGQLASELQTVSKHRFGMMAVGIGSVEAEDLIRKHLPVDDVNTVVVACRNSPRNTTLSGAAHGLAILEKVLASEKLFCKRLAVNVPYHSHYMHSVAKRYERSIGTIDSALSHTYESVVMVSSVTGQPLSAQQATTASYWVENMTSPVQFLEALRYVANTLPLEKERKSGQSHLPSISVDDALEVGPHSTLRSAMEETWGTVSGRGKRKIEYLSCMHRKTSARWAFLTALGTLFIRGYAVNTASVNNLSNPRPIPVNLPLYAFNHSQSHWNESRLSRAYRFRSHPRHDLLGVRNIGWNPLEAQWRHKISLKSSPWVEDHQINGDILYPGAGWIAMAIEASKQLIDDVDLIVGFHLCDVRFLSPLRISDSPQDCSITLRSSAAHDATADISYHFTIYNSFEDSYIKLCTGQISVVSSRASIADVTCPAGLFFHDDSSQPGAKSQVFTSDDLYRNIIPQGGANYGPKFQVLDSLQVSDEGESSFAVLRLEQRNSISNVHPKTSFTIPPPFLDGLFHIMLAHDKLRGTKGYRTAAVPSKIAQLWISNSISKMGEVRLLQAQSQVQSNGYRGVKGDIIVTKGDRNHLIAFEKAELTYVPVLSHPIPGPFERKLCSQMIWKPDIGCMSTSQLVRYCEGFRLPDSGAQDRTRSLNVIAHFFIDETLMRLDFNFDTAPRWLKNYISWMQMQTQDRMRQRIDESTLQTLRDHPEAKHEFIEKVKQNNRQSRLIVNVGEELASILSGKTDVENILSQDDDYNRSRSEILTSAANEPMFKSFIQLCLHRNPLVKILEIGAGDRHCTAMMLDILHERGVPEYISYDLTNKSSSSISNAQTKFGERAQRMRFLVFDFENEYTSQGFEGGTYDLILATDLSLITSKIDDVLQRIRSLLKSAGHLVLFETTNPRSVRGPFLEGLLNSWWKDTRSCKSLGPCLTTAEWKCAFERAGFASDALELRDECSEDLHERSILITQTPRHELSSIGLTAPTLVLLIDSSVKRQVALVESLQVNAETIGVKYLKRSLPDLANEARLCEDHPIISLLEVHQPLLADLSPSNFVHLKTILYRAQGIIWVTGLNPGSVEVTSGLVDGMARSLRSENPNLKFVVGHLPSSDDNVDHQGVRAMLEEIVHRTVSSDMNNMEPEYRIRDGLLETSRFVPSPMMNYQIARRLVGKAESAIDVHRGPPLKLSINTYGHIAGLHYRESDVNSASGTAAELLVRSHAFAFTHRDFLVSSGQVNERSLSYVVAGEVEQAGTDSEFSQGDRICIITPNASQTRLCCNTNQVVKLPTKLSFTEGASISVPAMMALHVLVEIARLEHGDQVLIHHASGAIGQVCIQLAQHLGIQIWTTVSSTAKQDFLASRYNIDRSRILSSQDSSFLRHIRAATQNKGVDAVINCFPQTFEASMRTLVPGGCFIDLGLVTDDSYNSSELLASQSITHARVDLFALWRNSPEKAARLFRRAMLMVEDGILVPPVGGEVVSLGDESNLLERYRARDRMGASVVSIERDARVNAMVTVKLRYRLHSDATYVIAGAFGGIGRVVARWMVQRGAKHLVLLSRSGSSSTSGAAFVQELADEGVQVYAPACNIAALPAVIAAFGHVRHQMPPVRGCFQATVVYRDSTFPSMTFSSWRDSLAPKVMGTENLLTALPTGLDFLVLLASTAAISGNAGQANYAAGNTFLDSMARHCVRTGAQPRAIALDLGLVVSDGYAAESADVLARVRAVGHWMELGAADLCALFDYYCDPERPLEPQDEDAAQLVVGMEMPSAMAERGVEPPVAMGRPSFRHFQLSAPDLTPPGLPMTRVGRETTRETLGSAESDEEAARTVMQLLTAKLASLLGLTEEEVDEERPLYMYGVDSLTGLQLRNWFDREIGADVHISEFLMDKPVREVTMLAARRSRFREVNLET